MAGVSMRETLKQIRRLFDEGAVGSLPDDALLRRFAAEGDEEAFSSLVARHGPMVLGVCRGVLRDPGDAEDAFQATFLTLARKARSLRPEGSLGGWLHRVARRTASKANARAIRRRGRERPEPDPDRIEGRDRPGLDEAAPALHEEIDRLPESYRRALVLCALEGLTQAEAARELGIGEATVRRRLAGAKERLRARLDRRGLALPATLATTSTPPPSWIAAASKLATTRAVPAGVAALVPTIASARLPWLAAGLVGLGLAGLVARRAEEPTASPPKAGPPRVLAQAPTSLATPSPKPQGETTFRGRVLGPDGAPAPMAKVYARPPVEPFLTTEAAVDPRGRFRLDFDARKQVRLGLLTDGQADAPPQPVRPRPVEAASGGGVTTIEYFQVSVTIDGATGNWPKVIAVAPGFGFGFGAAGPGDELVARLVADEPIEGRVVDPQGRPIARATVRVRGVLAPTEGDLTPWLDAARKATDVRGYYRAAKSLRVLGRHRDGLSAFYPGLLPAVTTDGDGRFRIVGVGRERVAWVAIEKPGIESRLVAVATRPGLTSFVIPYIEAQYRASAPDPSEDLPVHGPRFEHVAGPGRTIEGAVVERGTGAPIAGAKVTANRLSLSELSDENRYQATTDARGRYRVEGLPEGASPSVAIEVPRDQPYLGVARRVDIGRASEPSAVADFALARGVVIEGRVLDGVNGQPLKSAQIGYRVFPDNPHLPRAPDRLAPDLAGYVRIDEEGRYRIVVYPGRGLLTVFAGSVDIFAQGVGAEKVPGQAPQFDEMIYPTLPEAVRPKAVNLVAEVNPPEGAGPIALDLALTRAREREGRVIGPDGPVAGGLVASGLSGWMMATDPQSVEGGRVVVKGLSPGEERRVVVRLDEKRLIGLAIVKADEEGPFEVRLEPWATLGGRLVDAAGKPRSKGPGIQLIDDSRLPIYARGRGEGQMKPATFPVAEDGRFLAEALLPGQAYKIGLMDPRSSITGPASESLTLRPGEAKDLGDVTVQGP